MKTFHVARSTRGIGTSAARTARNDVCCHLEIVYDDKLKVKRRAREVNDMMNTAIRLHAVEGWRDDTSSGSHPRADKLCSFGSFMH